MGLARRSFLQLLGLGVATVASELLAPRKSYSFIWAAPEPALRVFTLEDVVGSVEMLRQRAVSNLEGPPLLVPPEIARIIRESLLERAFNDALFPGLLGRRPA